MTYLHYINYLAVIVSALVAFALGAVWYSPLLFAKQWIAFNGYGPDEIKAMQAGAKKAYGISFVCQVVTAFALAMLIAIIHMNGIFAGIKLALLCWLGFAVSLGLMAKVYSGRALKAFLLDAGYQLVYFVVMGVILVAWH